MKLILVTGCLGFIGSHVTRECLNRGWKVMGIDKCTYAANTKLLADFEEKDNFTFIKEDIVNLTLLPDCDYVINTAAETHVGNSILDSENFIRTNVDGVKNLLELIKNKPKNTVSRPIFLHFSTDEVYGDIIEGSHSEDSHLNPSNPYSASKASADMLIKAWHRTYGVDYVIVRPTNNYGIGQYPEKLIPLSVKTFKRGRRVRLHDEGQPYRNWLHVKDTASAVIKIIESGVKNEIYNISGNLEQRNITTVRKIINAYSGLTLDDQSLELSQYVNLNYKRQGQDKRYSVNDKKLRNLGWEPVADFDKEILKIVKYEKDNFRW